MHEMNRNTIIFKWILTVIAIAVSLILIALLIVGLSNSEADMWLLLTAASLGSVVIALSAVGIIWALHYHIQ